MARQTFYFNRENGAPLGGVNPCTQTGKKVNITDRLMQENFRGEEFNSAGSGGGWVRSNKNCQVEKGSLKQPV